MRYIPNPAPNVPLFSIEFYQQFPNWSDVIPNGGIKIQLVRRTYQCACPLSAKSGHRALFDHLVGGDEKLIWDLKSERLRGLAIDDQLVLGRQLYWKLAWIYPAQNAIDIGRSPPPLLDSIGRVGD